MPLCVRFQILTGVWNTQLHQMHTNMEALKWLHRPQAHFIMLCHWEQVSFQRFTYKERLILVVTYLKLLSDFLGARRGMLPETCICRAGKGAEAPPPKTVSNQRYLSWILFSNTLIPFLEAKSNLPSMALISAAFLESLLGNMSKGGGRWCPCSGELEQSGFSPSCVPCSPVMHFLLSVDP